MSIDIAKLRELLAAATPAPWQADDEARGGYNAHGNWTSWGRDLRDENGHPPLGGAPEMGMCRHGSDAALIAAMRNELPGLLDELEFRRDRERAALADLAAILPELERLRRLEAADIALFEWWQAHEGTCEPAEEMELQSLEEDVDEIVAECIAAKETP